jgi:hypothetical protein
MNRGAFTIRSFVYGQPFLLVEPTEFLAIEFDALPLQHRQQGSVVRDLAGQFSESR